MTVAAEHLSMRHGERHGLLAHVNARLADVGIMVEARVEVVQQCFDSPLSQAVENVHIYLPEPLTAISVMERTKLIRLLYQHAEGALEAQPGLDRHVFVHDPDGQLAHGLDVDAPF